MIESDTLSLSDQAYDVVERMIISLELPPGTVFSESELADQINIGRTPLREALQRLAGDMLIVSLPRLGMMVTEINASEYLNLLDTRGVLDHLIARQAARRASPRQRDALTACAEGIAEAAQVEDDQGFMRLDRSGDEILAAASRNTYASQAAGSLHAHCRRFWSIYRHFGNLSHSAELHSRILREVAAGHAEEAGKASGALIAYLEAFARRALDLE